MAAPHLTPGPPYAYVLLKSGDWKTDAACDGAEGDWVTMPTHVTWRGQRRDKNFELAVCADCAVRLDCLTYALENNETVGIWGGLVPYERQRVRNRLTLTTE